MRLWTVAGGEAQEEELRPRPTQGMQMSNHEETQVYRKKNARVEGEQGGEGREGVVLQPHGFGQMNEWTRVKEI